MSIDITSKNFNNYAKRLQKTLGKTLGLSAPLSLSQCSELLAKTLGFNTRHDLNKVLSTPAKDDEFQSFEAHRLSIENEVNNYLEKNPDSSFFGIYWGRRYKNKQEDIGLFFNLFHLQSKTIKYLMLNDIQENDFDLTEQDRQFILNLKGKFKKNNHFNENFNLYIRLIYNLNSARHVFLNNSNAYCLRDIGVAKTKYWLIPKTLLDEMQRNIVARDEWHFIQCDAKISPQITVDSVSQGISIIQKNQDLILLEILIFDSGEKFIPFVYFYSKQQIFMRCYDYSGSKTVPVPIFNDYLNSTKNLRAYLWGCYDYMLNYHNMDEVFVDENLKSLYFKGHLNAKSWLTKQPIL